MFIAVAVKGGAAEARAAEAAKGIGGVSDTSACDSCADYVTRQ